MAFTVMCRELDSSNETLPGRLNYPPFARSRNSPGKTLMLLAWRAWIVDAGNQQRRAATLAGNDSKLPTSLADGARIGNIQTERQQAFFHRPAAIVGNGAARK